MTHSVVVITQRGSVAKSVERFQRRLFVCLFVNRVNFRTSKHRMMKLWGGGRCTVQKSRPSLNFGSHSPPVRTAQNVALGYDFWKINAGCLVCNRISLLPALELSLTIL